MNTKAVLLILVVACHLASGLTQGDWDTKFQKYKKDITACNKAKDCEKKVNDGFRPTAKEAVSGNFVSLSSACTGGIADAEIKLKGNYIEDKVPC